MEGQRKIDESLSPGGTTACPSPAKGAIGGLTLSQLTGEAEMNKGLDPMAGRVLQESDPRAQALLAKQREQIESARRGNKGTRAFDFVIGSKVYHKERKKEYKVIALDDNDHVILKSKTGNTRRANISQLVKL
jgi:hypothetical protein